MKQNHSFVICVDNSGYSASLEARKIYLQLPDARAQGDGFVRVVDESGDDYLYPARLFVPISVPEEAEKAFSGAR